MPTQEHTPRFLFWGDGEIQPVEASPEIPCLQTYVPGVNGVPATLLCEACAVKYGYKW
jgi:hypothetical protein